MCVGIRLHTQSLIKLKVVFNIISIHLSTHTYTYLRSRLARNAQPAEHRTRHHNTSYWNAQHMRTKDGSSGAQALRPNKRRSEIKFADLLRDEDKSIATAHCSRHEKIHTRQSRQAVNQLIKKSPQMRHPTTSQDMKCKCPMKYKWSVGTHISHDNDKRAAHTHAVQSQIASLRKCLDILNLSCRKTTFSK